MDHRLVALAVRPPIQVFWKTESNRPVVKLIIAHVYIMIYIFNNYYWLLKSGWDFTAKVKFPTSSDSSDELSSTTSFGFSSTF